MLNEKQGRKLEKCSMCEFNMVYGFVFTLGFTIQIGQERCMLMAVCFYSFDSFGGEIREEV